MTVYRAVSPVHLGPDFDIGGELPNKVTVRFATTEFYGKVKFASAKDIIDGNPNVAISAANIKEVADLISLRLAQANGDLDTANKVSKLAASFESLRKAMQTISTQFTQSVATYDNSGVAAELREKIELFARTEYTNVRALVEEEAQVRISALESEASARQNLQASLETRLTDLENGGGGGANTAYVDSKVLEERNARVAADGAQADARKLLASAYGAVKLFTQPSPPNADDVFPVGVNRVWNSAFTAGTNWFSGFVSVGSAILPVDMDTQGWFIPGSHTAFVHYADALAASSYIELSSAFLPVTAGVNYEASAQIAAVNCLGKLSIDFYTSAGVFIAGVYSDSVAQASSDGADTEDKYVHATVNYVAPVNAAFAKVAAYGFGEDAADAYIFLRRPFLALKPDADAASFDWSIGNYTAQWINTDDNNSLHMLRYAGTPSVPAWVDISDSRIADNAAIIADNFTTLVGALNAEAQHRTDLESVVVANKASADFEAVKTWNFLTTAENWTAQNATLDQAGGVISVSATAASPSIKSPNGLTLDGVKYNVVRAKVKRVAGEGWAGRLRYSVQGGHDLSSSAGECKVIANTTLDGKWVILEWDMSGTDWAGVITQVALDLGALSTDDFDIDWIAVGRSNPNTALEGIESVNQSISSIVQQQVVLSDELSAQASDISELASSLQTAEQTLSSQIEDVNTTLSTAISSTAQSTTTLESSFTSKIGKLTTYAVATHGGSAAGQAGLFVDSGVSSHNAMAQGLNMWVITLATRAIDSFTVYDVSADASKAAAMAAALNALDNTKVVIVAAYGQTQANRLADGLDAAMYRCGATSTVFGSSLYKSNAAYILIGVPGGGAGSGAEKYAGDADNSASAATSISFTINNGFVSGLAGDHLTAAEIAANKAAIIQEAQTRVDNETAIANSLNAMSTRVGDAESAIATETTNRTNADSSFTNSLNSLTTRVGATEAEIANEQTTRVNQYGSLASNLTTLTTTMGTAASRKVWRQATEPALADMFPPSANRIYNSDFAEGTAGWYCSTNSANTATLALDLASYTLTGEHTIYANISSLGASEYLLLGAATYHPVVVGQKYEFSVYTGVVRCSAIVALSWLDASDAVISTDYSNAVNHGSELNSGVNSATGGGAGLSNYSRLWVYGTAPANAVKCEVFIQAYNGSGSNVYIFGTHAYFGVMRSDQTTPADYVRAQYDQVWYNTADSNKAYALVRTSWTAPAWTATADSRVDTNTSSISTLTSSVNGISVKYGIQGTINAQTGGFVFTGVLKNDGSVSYNMEINSNVTISGDLLVTGTVRNAALEALAATNLVYAKSPASGAGANSTGDVAMFIRAGSRVKLTITPNTYSETVNLYVNGNLIASPSIYAGSSNTRIITQFPGANILSGGTATATNGANPSAAFDANENSAWSSTTLPTAGSPVYLTYQLPVAVSIIAYKVRGYTITGATAVPSWTLQGSTNGTTWVDIHSGSRQAGGTYLEYTLGAQTAAYLYYRLKMTANDGYKVVVSEFTAKSTINDTGSTVVFKATDANQGSTTACALEMIVEEFSK